MLVKAVELYVNELSSQVAKLNDIRVQEDKEAEVAFSKNLSAAFESFARHFETVPQICFEILLTSFSLNPSQEVLDRITAMVECKTGPTVDVKLKMAASHNAMIGLPSETYVDFMNVIQSARLARLTCFRDSWTNFKQLCEKRLSTRGNDIKGGNDLHLAKPTDFTLYAGMKPAYDENDTGYEAGYCPEENGELEESEEVPQKKPKKIREPAFRMKMLIQNQQTSKLKVKNMEKLKARKVEVLSKKVKDAKLLINSRKSSSISSAKYVQSVLKERKMQKRSNRKNVEALKLVESETQATQINNTSPETGSERVPVPKKQKDESRKRNYTKRAYVRQILVPNRQKKPNRLAPVTTWPSQEVLTEATDGVVHFPRFPLPIPSRGADEKYSEMDRKLRSKPYVDPQSTYFIAQSHWTRYPTSTDRESFVKLCTPVTSEINASTDTTITLVDDDLAVLFSPFTDDWNEHLFGISSPVSKISEEPLEADLLETTNEVAFPDVKTPDSNLSSQKMEPDTEPCVINSISPPNPEPGLTTPNESPVESQALVEIPDSSISLSNTLGSCIAQNRDEFDCSALNSAVPSEELISLPVLQKTFLSEHNGEFVPAGDSLESLEEIVLPEFSGFTEDSNDWTNLDENTDDDVVFTLPIVDSPKSARLCEITGEIVEIDEQETESEYLSWSTGEFVRIPIDPCTVIDTTVAAVLSHFKDFTESSSPSFSSISSLEDVAGGNNSPETFSTMKAEDCKMLKICIMKLTEEELSKYDRTPVPPPTPAPIISSRRFRQRKSESEPSKQNSIKQPHHPLSIEVRKSKRRRSRAQVDIEERAAGAMNRNRSVKSCRVGKRPKKEAVQQRKPYSKISRNQRPISAKIAPNKNKKKNPKNNGKIQRRPYAKIQPRYQASHAVYENDEEQELNSFGPLALDKEDSDVTPSENDDDEEVDNFVVDDNDSEFLPSECEQYESSSDDDVEILNPQLPVPLPPNVLFSTTESVEFIFENYDYVEVCENERDPLALDGDPPVIDLCSDNDEEEDEYCENILPDSPSVCTIPESVIAEYIGVGSPENEEEETVTSENDAPPEEILPIPINTSESDFKQEELSLQPAHLVSVSEKIMRRKDQNRSLKSVARFRQLKDTVTNNEKTTGSNPTPEMSKVEEVATVLEPTRSEPEELVLIPEVDVQALEEASNSDSPAAPSPTILLNTNEVSDSEHKESNSLVSSDEHINLPEPKATTQAEELLNGLDPPPSTVNSILVDGDGQKEVILSNVAPTIESPSPRKKMKLDDPARARVGKVTLSNTIVSSKSLS